MPQYLPIGIENAPAQWTLPPGFQIQVEAVFAQFDGTGAAGAFIPTLQVISDGGETVIEVPQDASVAAGSSVVASWAPFLKGAPPATPASSGGLAWAFIQQSIGSFADTGLGFSLIDMNSGTFETTDPTVFQANSVGGFTGIEALTNGIYFVWVTCNGQKSSAPAAGSVLRCDTTSTIGAEFQAATPSGWFLTDSSPTYTAGATYGWQADLNGHSGPTPATFRMRAGQNTGGSILLDVWMQMLRVDTRFL